MRHSFKILNSKIPFMQMLLSSGFQQRQNNGSACDNLNYLVQRFNNSQSGLNNNLLLNDLS